jgi:transcriptional repressor NrdR
MSGLEKACQKRAIPAQKMDEMISRIERRLLSYSLKEVPSKTVGQMVMQELHQIDKVAYVRFASVYREFEDVHGFVRELSDAAETSKPDTSTEEEPQLSLGIEEREDTDDS